MAQLTLMAHEIASGMAFLAMNDFVHRDLACRNCLVGDDESVKIADFGLSRNIQYQEYYRKQGEAKVPVRWMAPECLQEAVYTTEGDVWSFGITLWEMFTFGVLPYPNMSNQEVMDMVCRTPQRLRQPRGCPDVVFRMMTECWMADRNARPSFTALAYDLRGVSARLLRGTSDGDDDLKCSSPVDYSDGSRKVSVRSEETSAPVENPLGSFAEEDFGRYKQTESRKSSVAGVQLSDGDLLAIERMTTPIDMSAFSNPDAGSLGIPGMELPYLDVSMQMNSLLASTSLEGMPGTPRRSSATVPLPAAKASRKPSAAEYERFVFAEQSPHTSETTLYSVTSSPSADGVHLSSLHQLTQ